MLGFEALTLCPIDRRLILPALLTAKELAWLNAYHAHVRATLLPLIKDSSAQNWLARATEAIAAE